MSHPLTSNLLVADLETSGTNASLHSPLAVGFVPLFGEAPPLLVYVRPPSVVWTDYARANFDRYSADWYERAMEPIDACKCVDDYLNRTFGGETVTLVGHNVGFDLAFLGKLAALAGRDRFTTISHRSLDLHTMLYLLYLQGRIAASALSSDGAFEHFGIDVTPKLRHTALGDASATRSLLIRVLQELFADLPSSERHLLGAMSR